MCWEKVREGGEEEDVTCCRRVSSNQKQSVQWQHTHTNTCILHVCNTDTLQYSGELLKDANFMVVGWFLGKLVACSCITKFSLS